MKNIFNRLLFICEKDRDHFAKPILDSIESKISYSFYDKSRYNYIKKYFLYNHIWVEWANRAAIDISRLKLPYQKLIIRLHRYEMTHSLWMRKIKWKNVDKLIFVNTDLMKQFQENINKDVNCCVIPNAININDFPLTKRSDKNSVLAYGLEFHPIKAYHKLIKLFSKIVENDPSFTLTIAGGNPTHEVYIDYYEKCKKMISDLNMSNNIQLQKLDVEIAELKNHPNINNLLSQHNAIISYSDVESFHYAFAEGLSAGLYGFCRGWRELNPYEFWSDWCYDNEEKIIDALLKWGKLTVESRNEIGEKNRNHIINNYSSQVISQKYKNLLKN